MNPWLNIPAEDYAAHMEHVAVRQGALLREHLSTCLTRFTPGNLMFLGAGIGNGLQSDAASRLEDILAVDVNPDYLTVLRHRFPHLPIRLCCCNFPTDFGDCGQFDLIYAALFFEYVDVEASLSCIARHLTGGGMMIALLQQPSTSGRVCDTGVSSLYSLRDSMTLYHPDTFFTLANAAGLRLVAQETHTQQSKQFIEVRMKAA